MKSVWHGPAIAALVAFSMLQGCASLCPGVDEPQPKGKYRYTLSSGLFSLPLGARSVDWVLLNNSKVEQEFRVTIYQAGRDEKTSVSPGPLSGSLKPFHTFHNANSVGKTFWHGYDYEVVVESNSLKLLPSVEVWSDHGNTVIPGTWIGPAQFVDITD